MNIMKFYLTFPLLMTTALNSLQAMEKEGSDIGQPPVQLDAIDMDIKAEIEKEKNLIDKAYKDLLYGAPNIPISLPLIRNHKEKALNNYKYTLLVVMRAENKNPFQDIKDFGEVFDMIKDKAKKGEAKYQFLLGIMFERGRGVDKDDKKAFDWFQEAANQGYALSQFKLGGNFDTGCGVKEDKAEAFKWFHAAAKQGHSTSQNNVGYFYFKGWGGINQNDIKAVKWLTRSAEQGFAQAQFALGWTYENGYGITKDLNKAVELYQKSAEQDHVGAQNELFRLFKFIDILPMEAANISFESIISVLDSNIGISGLWAGLHKVDMKEAQLDVLLKDETLSMRYGELLDSLSALKDFLLSIKNSDHRFLLSCLSFNNPKIYGSKQYKGTFYVSIGSENLELSKKIFSILKSSNSQITAIKELLAFLEGYNHVKEVLLKHSLDHASSSEEKAALLNTKEQLEEIKENFINLREGLNKLPAFLEDYLINGAAARNQAFFEKNPWLKK